MRSGAVLEGSYTAISAFRTHYNPILTDQFKQAPDKVAQIRSIRGKEDGDVAQGYSNRICTAYKWWHRFSILPIGLFLLFAFGMSLWLFFHWDKIAGTFDSELCRTMTEINAGLNFLSLIGAFSSFWVIRSSNKILTDNYRLAAKASVTAQK
jgi:hypothetical protein